MGRGRLTAEIGTALKDTKILLFLEEYYKTKTDIIWYYLLPNSIALKL